MFLSYGEAVTLLKSTNKNVFIFCSDKDKVDRLVKDFGCDLTTKETVYVDFENNLQEYSKSNFKNKFRLVLNESYDDSGVRFGPIFSYRTILIQIDWQI